MKSIVVANWKMNPQSFREAKRIFEATKKALDKSPGVSVIVAPPSVYLRELASSYRGRRIFFAAQNAHYEPRGGFTGEISLNQARDSGAQFVLVGHSERRAAGETNEDTRKKVEAALGAKLQPILCIGESEKQRGGEQFNTIKEQLRVGLRDIAPAEVSRVLIAYEPAWAIGGETTISPREMHEMSIFIIKTVVDMHGEAGHKVKVLYGASIGEHNAAAMMRESTVKGLIVGHVSIDPVRFSALLQSISEI